MAIQEFQLGQFLPDAADYKNPGLVLCNNVYALPNSYAPILDLVGQEVFIYGDIRGGFRFDLPDGEQVLAVGTEQDLFVVRGNSVTRSNLNLSLQENEFWSFDQFQDAVFATTKQGNLYKLPSIFTDNTFVVASGSPPKANSVNTIGNFLMLGDLEETNGDDKPFRVRWSSFNNPDAAWDTDIARQSGYVDMPPRLGKVTAISGGLVDLIFQHHGISKIWYTGGATVFSKKIIEDERGCPSPTSIVRVGAYIYFLSHDGFCRTDGESVEVISSNKVWDWFNSNRNKNNEARVQGVVNWNARSIIWSFNAYREIKEFISINDEDPNILNDHDLDITAPSFDDDGVQIIYSKQIIYNWGLDQWTTAEFDADWLVQSNVLGISIDQDDPGVENDDVLDATGKNFDDISYVDKGRELAAFKNNQLSYFTGGSLRATFETGDFQPQPGNRSFVRSVLLLAETSERSLLVSVAGRDYIGDQKQYREQQNQGSLMFCPVISDARFHSLRFTIPENTSWNKASSFQVDWVDSGAA